MSPFSERVAGRMGASLAILLGLMVAIMGFSGTTLSLPGDLLLTVYEPEPLVSCCGIGVEYDGSKILYTHYGDNTIHFTDLSAVDLGQLALINADSSPYTGDCCNAIAFNFGNGFLYGGGWGSTNLYKVDMSTGVVTLVMATAVPLYYGFIDGLAWDPTTDTFWMSDDVQCNVEHLDVLGNDIGGFDGCTVTGYANSGLAVGLDGTLFYGTDGNGLIFALDTTTSPPTNLGQFASPGGRDEDMSCGPEFTKPDGSVVETLLSQDAYDNSFVVIEMEPGKCVSPAEALKGRMTGGGSVFTPLGQRVTHGFELHCDISLPNNLEINWGGNRFHLTLLNSATCKDDPLISEGQPVAGFDTFVGSGIGRLNGAGGATIDFNLTDAGEPGKGADLATFSINGGATLAVSGLLDRGNHQAHPP